MATLAHGSNINLDNHGSIGDAVLETLSSLALALKMSHRAENTDLSNPDAVHQIWVEYEAAMNAPH